MGLGERIILRLTRPSSAPLPGECRHRQRAFYDFLKDVVLGSGFAELPGLIRISDRTDFINGHPPAEVVERGTLEERQALVNLLRERASAAVG